MITSICRLNTALLVLFLLALASTGHGFMSENKKVVIHIPDEITYVRHFHPTIVYLKKKHHGHGFTGLKGGGLSGGRNPLKLLLSSEIHSSDIKPGGWSSPGILNQDSYPVGGGNNWPPTGLKDISPHEVNDAWVENEIKLHDLHISNNNEFPPLNTFGDNTAPNINLGQGQYGLPENDLAGGLFNSGNQDLGHDLHQTSSSLGVNNLGPQLFSNNGGNNGLGNNVFPNGGGSNLQSEFGHNEGNSFGNFGGHGSDLSGGSLVGHNSEFSQAGIPDGHVNNNGNGWPGAGLADSPSPQSNTVWSQNVQVGGSQPEGSNDWIPVSHQPDNSLWWPMNVEHGPQNHASQSHVHSNLNQDISNLNLGHGTQGGTNVNDVTGNGVQEGIPHASPYTQIQSSQLVAEFTSSNNGPFHSIANALTSSVEVPWAWKDQSRPAAFVNAGINGNAQHITHHPGVSAEYSPNNIQNFESAANYYGNGQSNGYATAHNNRPHFESAANYGGYTGAANGITNNNGGIGANQGVFSSNFVSGVSHNGQIANYGANSDSYRTVGTNFGSNNQHGAQTHNGFSAQPNIGAHTQHFNGNQGYNGGFNSYQSAHIKNANNIACKRFKQRRVKVDSYHPCYEPNNEAYHPGHNQNNPIDSSYNMPINVHSGGSNAHANNGIYPFNSNIHGAGINNHGNGGNHNRPFFGNHVNNYEGNSVQSGPIYGPVNNAQFNHIQQGYTETMSTYAANINNANNFQQPNHGGIGANGAIGNVNYENNEVGTHVVVGGSAAVSHGYYGQTGIPGGVSNQAGNIKHTRPNVIFNGVNSGSYVMHSGANYSPTRNHFSSTPNTPISHGALSNNPSHTQQPANIYYDNNGNTYNTVGATAASSVNNNPNLNGHVVPGTSHTYGGNTFEVSSNGPFVSSGNVQGYSNAPTYGANAYDAHSSPSSTNIGALLSYVNTDDNNVNLKNKEARSNYFGRSGANRLLSQVPSSNYGSPSNNYRSTTNGSLADITSEHGSFVSYPTNSGQSTYRGNSNSFITSANYDSSTSRPQYAEAPEHRGLPFTTQVGPGPIAASPATGGRVPPTLDLNSLNEIIQNSNIYKGIANGNADPNKYTSTAANFGVTRGVHNRVPSKQQFVTNVEYRKPNPANLGNVAYRTPSGANNGNVVYRTPNGANNGNVVYSTPTSANNANVVYSTPTSANNENVVYSAPTSANNGNVVYSAPNSAHNGNNVYTSPTSANNGNLVYSAPTSANNENVVYSAPTNANNGNVYSAPTSANVYSAPTSANHGNVVYTNPTSPSQGNVIYSVPTKINNDNAVYSIPNHGNVVYSAPININDGKGNIYRLPNKVNHGKNNAHRGPTSINQGYLPYSLPNSVNQGANNVYRVPSSGSQGNVEYTVPNRVSHGANNVYSIPNTVSPNNIVYSVPANGGQSENNVYSLNKPSSQVVNNVPNSGNLVNTVYSVPNSPSQGTNNAYNVPSSGNLANNNVYTVPNSASHGNNVVYSVPNDGSHGNVVYNVPINPGQGNNIVYNVPNSGSNGNVLYSVPNSSNHGGKLSHSAPNNGVHGYIVPGNVKPGNTVYRGPSAVALANSGPQTFTGSEVFGNPSTYSVPDGGNQGILGPYSPPDQDNYRNESGFGLPSSQQQVNSAALQGLTSSDNRGNNAAYDSYSSSSGRKNPNRQNQFSGTNFVNHINRLVSSDSNRNVAYRVPSAKTEGNNSSSLSQSGSNLINAYSEPVNKHTDKNVLSISNTVNHGNNAYSVSNSVRHINTAYSVETTAGNGKENHGAKSAQDGSTSHRNHGKVKRRRLKTANHKLILPEGSSSDKDIIANIHEEAIKFVENYKVPAYGNRGPGDSSDRQWSKRQNVRSMNGVYANRKSIHTGKVGADYAIQNDDNRANNYTPSGPDNMNVISGSRTPFNVNHRFHGRNYANRPLRNLSNSENDEATRNYVTSDSYGGYNSRKFRGI